MRRDKAELRAIRSLSSLAGPVTKRGLGKLQVAAVPLTFGLSIVGHSSDARAYCRTTTCDVSHDVCARDAQGCSLQGQNLSWASGCIRVQVGAGSSRQHISSIDVVRAANRAFNTWSQAACQNGPPSLAFDIGLPAPDLSSQARLDGRNFISFRDSDWPHHDLHSNIALTTLTIDAPSGHIIDADIELNSFAQPFHRDAAAERYDLELVLLHEVGHVLGFGHSNVERAKMGEYYAQSESGLRLLAKDDEEVMCASYPPSHASGTCDAPTSSQLFCDSLEQCRFFAAGFLALCWATLGLIWRWRLGCSRRRSAFSVSPVGRLRRGPHQFSREPE